MLHNLVLMFLDLKSSSRHKFIFVRNRLNDQRKYVVWRKIVGTSIAEWQKLKGKNVSKGEGVCMCGKERCIIFEDTLRDRERERERMDDD